MKITVSTNKDNPNKITVLDSKGNSLAGSVLGMNITLAPQTPPIASMDVLVTPENLECLGILSFESLVASAAFYGMKLVKDERGEDNETLEKSE